MKNKLKFIIPVALTTIFVVVMVVVNPFGENNLPSGGNSVNPGGHNSSSGTSELSGEGEGEQTNPGEEGEQVPITFRISPGKFYLHDGDQVFTRTDTNSGLNISYTGHGDGSYTAGESREYQLMVTNKNTHTANFSVDYRVPDSVISGYSRPTSEVRDWVWISDSRPEIPAGETVAITIRLGMPSYANPPGEKWEFWIGVIDQSQTGWLITELANRWLVTMVESGE